MGEGRLNFAFEQVRRDGFGQDFGAGKDFGTGIAVQGKFGEFLGLGELEMADEELDGGQEWRRGAEFIHAQAEQERRHDGVAAHLAANGGVDAVMVGGVHGGLDETQDGGVRGLVEVRDLFVQPVHRQGVLDEVVGAEAEKFGVFAQQVGDDRRRGDLDHHADSQVLVKGHVLGAQLDLALFEKRVGLQDFIQPRDHRVHHLDIALHAGAEDGPQLGTKDVAFLEAEPDGAPAEKGVHLARDIQVREKLIAAEIEGADGDRVRLEPRGDGVVGLVLLFLRGQRVLVDEKIFGAEKADAIGAVIDDALGVGGLLDVGGEDDAMAVERDGGHALHLAELFLEGDLAADDLAVFKKGLVGGVDDDDAVIAVQQGVLAVLEDLAEVLEADDGGDLHGTGHDRGVRGLAADVGGEPEDLDLVKLRGGGGREVVADDDAGLAQGVEIRAMRLTLQIVQHPPGDVAHVGGAFAKIFILDGGQRGGVFLGDGVEGVLDVDLVLLDHARGLLDEDGVLEQEQVRVEDQTFLGAHAGVDLALDLQDVVPGLDERVLEAAQLGAELVIGDRTFGDAALCPANDE